MRLYAIKKRLLPCAAILFFLYLVYCTMKQGSIKNNRKIKAMEDSEPSKMKIIETEQKTIIKETSLKHKFTEEQPKPIIKLNKNETILKFYSNLKKSEHKIYSRHGEGKSFILTHLLNSFKTIYFISEDGVINYIFEYLEMIPKKFYVEIGVSNGITCNTRNLLLKGFMKWKGIMFDYGFQIRGINLHQEKILPNNVLEIFKKYNLNDEIDLLSVDTGYQDYWILESIITKYHPKVVIHRVNQQKPPISVTVPKTQKIIFFDRTHFYGGSVAAFWCLAQKFDYSMVYCEMSGTNCFWIRNDILLMYFNLKDYNLLKTILNPEFLFKESYVKLEPVSNDKKWHEINC
jgi:hypothetical protein